MKLQQQLLDRIEGRKSAPIALPLLRLLSLGYGAGVKVRNRAYDRGYFKAQTLSIPIISVGNIVAGGTGKTPLTAYIARQLIPEKKVAILSRGYRGALGNQILQVMPETPAKLCGDEPKLLARWLPEVLIFVGKNRIQAALQAQALGAEILILDDGLQHRRLGRSVEIITLHKDNLFGHGAYLPRGLLRDEPRRLKEATLIAVQGITCKPELEEAKERLNPYTQAPIVGFENRVEDPEKLKGKKVAAFCAIAKPERFFSTLNRLGAQVVVTETLPDHMPFSSRRLHALAKTAKALGAECLVCTEKDHVKLKNLPNFPLETLKLSLAPIVGELDIRSYL